MTVAQMQAEVVRHVRTEAYRAGYKAASGIALLPIYSLEGYVAAERRRAQVAIRARMMELGVTGTELAKRAKLARPYVSQIVHGRIYRPRAQARIEKVLGIGQATQATIGTKATGRGKGEE